METAAREVAFKSLDLTFYESGRLQCKDNQQLWRWRWDPKRQEVQWMMAVHSGYEWHSFVAPEDRVALIEAYNSYLARLVVGTKDEQ